jgi:acyl-CoA thioesterase
MPATEPAGHPKGTDAVIRHMFSRDRWSNSLGLELLACAPGQAKLRLQVQPDMVNGLGTGHGGVAFSLADTAFAFACNSRNAVTVAQSASIDFLLPVQVGDTLVAEAVEQSLVGRSGVYYVTVTNQRAETVACFRGLSRRIRGEILPQSIPSPL